MLPTAKASTWPALRMSLAAIAISLGAEAPFSRPPELSTDHVATAPVIRHALEWLQHHRFPEFVSVPFGH